jgi:hypothetical protein
LERADSAFRSAAVQPVAVTLSPPAEAAAFCAQRAAGVRCLSDPSAEFAAYQAYGLTTGSLRELVGPENFAAGIRATLRGQTIGLNTRGQSLATERMMPGTFLVGADGLIRAAHYARYAGDLPDLTAMLRTGGRRTG